jgi:hypothetical protein
MQLGHISYAFLAVFSFIIPTALNKKIPLIFKPAGFSLLSDLAIESRPNII